MNDNKLAWQQQAERLQEVKAAIGSKSTSQFALDIEMDASQLGKTMRAELGLPYVQAKKIYSKYGYNIEWLMDGTGEKKVRTITPNEDEIYKQKYIAMMEEQLSSSGV